jgi:peptide/nickel transport system ATP-binding protein
MSTHEILYKIQDLSVDFDTRFGSLGAVDHVSLDIRRGEVLGLVGESGCGKSTLGKALMRMIEEPGEITSGTLIFDGIDILSLDYSKIRELRGSRISMVFQDPMTSLNPVQRVVNHITEAIQVHQSYVTDKEARARAADLVDRLGIAHDRLDDYPHHLSGGMRQRVMIGLGLALRADLVIADEATTSLDVIVEAQFLDLLRELRNEFDLTILLITHNIGIVAELADRVAVMYAGRMAELAGVNELFSNPKHPYTEGLLKAVPNIQLDEGELYKMSGSPPDLIRPPSGCRFHPRCPKVMEICSRMDPTFQSIGSDRMVNCWLYQEIPDKDLLAEASVK